MAFGYISELRIKLSGAANESADIELVHCRARPINVKGP